MLNIHNDTGSRDVLRDENPVDQELEALEGLLPASDKALGLVGPDLENQVSFLKLFLDFHKETEMTEDGLQDFFGCLVHRSGGVEETY